MAKRSTSDRGFRAERMPIGTAISIHITAPPSTRDAVTGAAAKIEELTLWRSLNEYPRLPWKTSRPRKCRNCT